MFVAIVLPQARSERSVMAAALIAVGMACVFRWWDALAVVSDGWAVIIASVLAAAAAAWLFPRREEA